MRYKLANVVDDNLHISDDIYHEDSIEASKLIHQFKTSDDGVEYYHDPGVRASIYIPEPHPLFNTSVAGDCKGIDFVDFLYISDMISDISDIALNQLRSYLKK